MTRRHVVRGPCRSNVQPAGQLYWSIGGGGRFLPGRPMGGISLGPGDNRTARAHDSYRTLRMGKAVALRLWPGALKIGGREGQSGE